MKIKVHSLDELQFEFSKGLVDVIGQQDLLREVIGDKVSSKVKSEVYDKHNPSHYKRRGIDDGLADPDNVERTSLQTNGTHIQAIYENTTEGVDTLIGQELTQTIEEGIKGNWSNPNGEWAEPRPFIEPAVEELKSESELRSTLVKMLRQSGYSVK